ncbi:MAG: tetratricopeptide repeat protein, partial [Acidobacteria bacterium]|nr:tetratricopeptide repeat protein [Acidobacteriota bacterium]
KGLLRPALEHYMTALEVKQAYADAKQDDLARKFDVSITLNHVGFVRERLGELQIARNFYLAEAAILTSLCERDPMQVPWRQHLATNHNYLGTLAEAMGDEEECLRRRRADVELERALVQLDPANMEWKRNLAVTEMRLGDVLRRQGDLAGALAGNSTSERLMREVIATDPLRVPWQRALGVIRLAHARVLLAEKQPSAIVTAEDAHALLATATESSWLRYAAEADLVRGDALAMRGDEADARKAWTRARQTIEPIASAATEPTILDVWLRTLIRDGDEEAAQPVAQRLAALGYQPADLQRFLRN